MPASFPSSPQVLNSEHARVLSHFSHIRLSARLLTVACQAPLSMGFSRKEYRNGCHDLLQEIFPTQGSNPCLLCLLNWQGGRGSLPQTPLGKPIKLRDTPKSISYMLISIKGFSSWKIKSTIVGMSDVCIEKEIK